MNVSELKAWLKKDDLELVSSISTDINRHVHSLRSHGEPFYGYAVLPGDYQSQPDPASISIAYNSESDLAEENRNDPYYRYSVDEWQNYIDDGFEDSCQSLRSSLRQFKEAHSRDPDSFEIDEFELAYISKINRSILRALLGLRQAGIFEENTFLVIWYSDSNDDILSQSAKILNKREIHRKFASEFK